MTEKYRPTYEEVKRAEEMMPLELMTASQIRDRFKYQLRDPFDDFNKHIDDKAERRKPTPEEAARMDSNLIKLGKIFEGTTIRWQLDGALNISVVRGEYIGVHKDIDLSIDKDDLEKLDDQLGQNHYGLFLVHPKNPALRHGQKIYERVGAEEFGTSPKEHLMIAAIDGDGRIVEQKVESLNFLDVHLAERDVAGDPIGWRGVPLPKEWYGSKKIIFKGQEINISHPAKTAYWKLHSDRNYDATDLRILAMSNQLTVDDVDDIESIIRLEGEALKKIIKDKLGNVIEKFTTFALNSLNYQGSLNAQLRKVNDLRSWVVSAKK